MQALTACTGPPHRRATRACGTQSVLPRQVDVSSVQDIKMVALVLRVCVLSVIQHVLLHAVRNA